MGKKKNNRSEAQFDLVCNECGSDRLDVAGVRYETFIGYYEVEKTIVCLVCGNILEHEREIIKKG